MKEILIPLNFTTTPTVYDTKQSFSTSDEASWVLTFTTTADVAGTVASLTIRNASENANRQTVLIDRLDVNSSPFSYWLKNPLSFGQYEGTVLLKKNLTVIASVTFLFGVNSSLSAEVLPDLVKAYALDELVENVETEVSYLKDAFTLTVRETVKGVNKTESRLQAQENVRYLNEHTRKTNEQARIAAEVDRKVTFDALVASAVIEQEVAEKYQEMEETYANQLISNEQQLAENTTVLQGIDKTFGDITFATLLALQTAYPTGNTKRYIVAADGKWYYWSGSAWVAGQVAQAIGIVDKSQGLNQLSSDLSLANYPFTNPSVRKDLLKFGVVLDAVLIGADRTKAYTIGGLRKNFGATNSTRIQVHEWDLTTDTWAGGSVATAIRASWNKDNYVPVKTTEIVKLAAIGASGFKVELLVDWTKIPDGISYSWEGGHFHLFHPNTISKGQTFLPNVFKSRQNIDKAFPDNAFYTGHWFKKTVNAKECISTNLFGAEINLIFKGSRITINTEVVDYPVALYAAIDGVGSSWIDLSVSGEKVIKSGLADTEHILTLWTQPRFGDTADASPFFSGKGGINIIGFNVPTFPIYGSKRTLVFYGDSITAGQEDRFIGYAKRIEQFLPVNTIRIAQPAAPLVRRTDRPFIPTLQQFYNQSSDGTYAIPAPGDVILINIGTNDTSGDVTQLKFETALTNLVTGLKIRHSGAPICLISPFGGYRATETANVAAATGVYLVDTSGWTYTTADGIHPNEAGGIDLAQKLSADLMDKFGFDFFN